MLLELPDGSLFEARILLLGVCSRSLPSMCGCKFFAGIRPEYVGQVYKATRQVHSVDRSRRHINGMRGSKPSRWVASCADMIHSDSSYCLYTLSMPEGKKYSALNKVVL